MAEVIDGSLRRHRSRVMIRAMGSELAMGVPSGVSAPASGQRLAEMLGAHFRVVWRTLRRLGLNAAAADDGAQQVFLIASQRLGEVEPGRERAFLIGTAYRVAANTRRKAARRNEVSDDDDFERQPHAGPNPEELVERKR